MKEDSTFQDIILNHFNAPEDQLLAQKVEELRIQSADNERIFQETKTIWETAVFTKRLYLLDGRISVGKFKDLLYNSRPDQRNTYIWPKIAAAAAILLIAVYLLYPQKNKPNELVKETSQQTDSLYLSDGTKIMLAAHTSIRYPLVLAKDSRQITLLKGQAFFKVHRDVKRPFHILIGPSKVSVLGTSFNINYSPSAIQLAVKTGKVMFSPNEVSSPAVLVAGQALNYDLKQHRIEWKNASNANSWMTKELEFVDMPLDEVCRQLSAYYHVSIVVRDQMHTAKKFNAHFKDSTLPEILRVLKQTYRIRIDSNDHVITIKNL